jgi:hypothetical protein
MEDPLDPLDREIDLGAPDVEPEERERRWPLVAMFLAFAVLTAMSVGFFLRSSEPAPSVEKKGVDETIVDIAAPNAPDAPDAPVAPSAPNASTSAPTAPNATADKPDAPNAPSTPVTGRVLIRSTPAEADVVVNGKLRGKTPLALRDLALGSYTIRVARHGYVPEERTLQLTSERPSTATTFDLRSAVTAGVAARLNVQSRPAGARVYVNGRLAGATPVAIRDLPAGPATVRIEMDGYRLWTTKVQVSADEQTRVAASLERQ